MNLYKDFNRVNSYKTLIPENYKYTDYSLLAKNYDNVVFDFDARGKYLPLIWKDNTFDSFGIPAYVGDGRMNKDGAQEAVTTIAAVLSASLLGIDKSNQDGIDYVDMLNAYYCEAEGIILNNPSGSSATTSMWYLLYPAILYTQVSSLYDNVRMNENVLKNIESWYNAYLLMYNNGEPDFDYTGFNFLTQTPYRNDIWKEPDCAVGIAVLMYKGYELTQDEKYLTATINLMDYMEDYFGSPLYEALMYFAPALVAQLNAFHGTHYDITKSLNRVFDGTSIPRGGWGSMVGKWGDYEVDGLFGSTTDGGGYAFAMNTFAAAGAITPMVRYDSRYARSIGKWMLHLSSNARYYFYEESNKENQSVTYVDTSQGLSDDILTSIPYEGIRKESNGRTPWIGGDPTVYGWALTDFSLYSGSHIGVLGSIIQKTNQDAILKIDLLQTELMKTQSYPTYLIYNPYNETKEITYYRDSNDNKVDLFDTVSNSVVAKGVLNETSLVIAPDSAFVIVEIPENSEIINHGLNNYVNGTYISSNRSTVSITNLENHQSVKGKFNLEISLASNYVDSIKEAKVIIDNVIYTVEGGKITLNTKDFTEGSKKVTVKITTENGLYDETSIRLNFK